MIRFNIVRKEGEIFALIECLNGNVCKGKGDKYENK